MSSCVINVVQQHCVIMGVNNQLLKFYLKHDKMFLSKLSLITKFQTLEHLISMTGFEKTTSNVVNVMYSVSQLMPEAISLQE